MSTTTIKVTTERRDRLHAQAAQEGRTMGSLVEELLDEHLRRQRFQRLRAAYAASVDTAYLDEVREWDETSSDGL